MVPRLLSGKEAKVGEVNRALRWSAAVPVPEVSCSRGAVVVGAAVVGGGSAGRTCEEEGEQRDGKGGDDT